MAFWNLAVGGIYSNSWQLNLRIDLIREGSSGRLYIGKIFSIFYRSDSDIIRS